MLYIRHRLIWRKNVHQFLFDLIFSGSKLTQHRNTLANHIMLAQTKSRLEPEDTGDACMTFIRFVFCSDLFTHQAVAGGRRRFHIISFIYFIQVIEVRLTFIKQHLFLSILKNEVFLLAHVLQTWNSIESSPPACHWGLLMTGNDLSIPETDSLRQRFRSVPNLIRHGPNIEDLLFDLRNVQSPVWALGQKSTLRWW